MSGPLDIRPSRDLSGRGVDAACFASPLAGRASVEAGGAALLDQLGRVLDDVGTAEPGDAAPPAPVAVILTGGTEGEVLDWLRPHRGGGRGGPLILLAVPHSNSLPASLEILACLGQEGIPGRIIVAGHPGWEDEFVATLRAVRTIAFLSRARIGLVGGPSDWLVASSPTTDVVGSRWGPEVLAISLEEVLREVAASGGDPDDLEQLGRGAVGIAEPDRATLAGAVALRQALDRLVARYRLDAVTVRCFDLLGPLNNTGCVALSRLNDRGVTAACEGDLPALLTMMVLQWLSGRPTFMANPSDTDRAKGLLTFGHCSVPLGIVSSYRLRSHFESGVGVGLEGYFSPGVMTVARIGGRDLSEWEVFTGRLAPGAHRQREDLCRTQVTLEVGEPAVAALLSRPLGNHHIIAPGDQAAGFRLVAELVTGRGTAYAAGR